MSEYQWSTDGGKTWSESRRFGAKRARAAIHDFYRQVARMCARVTIMGLVISLVSHYQLSSEHAVVVGILVGALVYTSILPLKGEPSIPEKEITHGH